MMRETTGRTSQSLDGAWVAFPGGELEGERPKLMCPACLDRANQRGTLCFQCYRAGLDRERRIRAAAELHTASEARFQSALPFEPVNRPRLERLRAERVATRAALQSGSGRFVDRQHRAQIAARHALQGLAAAAGFKRLNSNRENPVNPVNPSNPVNPVNPVNLVNLDSALHAATLQLPETWLPFVMSL